MNIKSYLTKNQLGVVEFWENPPYYNHVLDEWISDDEIGIQVSDDSLISLVDIGECIPIDILLQSQI